MKRIFFLILTIPLLLVGCHKDPPDTPPVVTIDFPGANSSFNVIDTVNFKVRITDDEDILNLKVSLVNNAFTPEGNPQSWSINLRSATINDFFLINQPSLPSGNYYLVFEVTDNRDYTKKFVPVTLNGIPKKLMNVILFTANSQTSTIEILDTALQSINSIIFNSQFQDGMASSYQQNIFYLSQNGQLSVLDAETQGYYWSESNLNTLSHDYLGHLTTENPYVLVPYNYCVRSYGNDGAFYRTYTIPSVEQRPVVSFVSGNYLFVVTKPYTNTPSRMYKYYFNTNVLADSYMLDYSFDPTTIIQANDDKIFIFGNIQGETKLYEYYFADNIVSTVDGLPAGSFYDAVKIDDQRTLISIDGNIYQLNPLTYSMININPALHGYNLDYNFLDNTIWLANGNELFVYTYPLYQQVGHIVTTDSIAKTGLLFNHD
ncbi:MAG: hypothetical protein J7L46_00940 [Bacteroidales bacterium]|nr:hypothetical protein [Bacteroidales bacterium]